MEINRKSIIGVILVIFATGSLFYSAYYFGKKQAQKESVGIVGDKSTPSVVQNTTINQIAAPADLNENVIKKSWIKWQEPQDLGNIGLTNPNIFTGCRTDCEVEYLSSNGIKYVKSGDVIRGKYQGHELIVVVDGTYEGPSITPNIFRILRKGNNIVFLTNGFDEYFTNFIQKVFFMGSSVKELNNSITIEELEYLNELSGLNDRQKFALVSDSDIFFTDAKLRKAFYSEKYGQVWTTDEAKALNQDPTPFELNSYLDLSDRVKKYYDIFDRYGFYIKAPDGTTVVYKMKLDIFDKNERIGILQSIWNDGTRNTKEYEENPSGCGGGNYVYNETLNFNLNTDLVIVGKTIQGDPLYGYKDITSSDFQKVYNNAYWPGGSEKKKSAEDFLKMNPKVFWKDYFGRLLAFYNADIISPAECGKPVIYLYPEKDQYVHVEVAPGNGLSFTEPTYNNGWDVLAKVDGTLINLADNKQYPYLFWEGYGGVYYQVPEQGFVVSRSNLNNFLDEKLSKLGLISKEIFDFKEFWLPKMLENKKPYFFVTFLSKNYIDKLAPLRISPKPDSIIRVMMDYYPLDEDKQVPELKIKTPERNGFTAAEWGGMLK